MEENMKRCLIGLGACAVVTLLGCSKKESPPESTESNVSSPIGICKAIEKAGYAKDCRDGALEGTWAHYGDVETECRAIASFSFLDSADQERRAVACTMENMKAVESKAKFMRGANSVLPADHVYVVQPGNVLLTIPNVKGYVTGKEFSPHTALIKILGRERLEEFTEAKLAQ